MVVTVIFTCVLLLIEKFYCDLVLLMLQIDQLIYAYFDAEGKTHNAFYLLLSWVVFY